MRISPFVRCHMVRYGILAAVVILFVIYFRGSSVPHSRSSNMMKDEILELSRQYLRDIAEEQRNVVDHPYAVSNTQYDLKKTLAVLLESVLSRLDAVESALNAYKNDSLHAPAGGPSSLSAKDLIAGVQEECALPKDWKINNPDCEGKLRWMENFWQSDPCYAANGVDGSPCSFLIYLSEVEEWCPRLHWRPQKNVTLLDYAVASTNRDLDALFSLMNDNPTNFEWIKARISRMWPTWIAAYESLEQKQKWTLANRNKKKIMLHLGFLTRESGFKFGEKSWKGGPLGELVQWSDLIAALYILGHDLQISSEISTFISFAQADPALQSSCPVLKEKHVDIIYTDIVGLRQMKKKIPASLQNYKCRLRVLDSFGTQAEFNYNPYFLKHKQELGGKQKNAWGDHQLELKQFYNMFPHTPDNTFLGFVVETHLNESEIISGNFTKQSWALIYGKELYMWKDAEPFLDIIREFAEIHATVNAGKDVPLMDSVVNHGVLSGKDLHSLLRQTKIFVGLGFPYEGPAPLEAIANGAIFINPKFSPPKGRTTEAFFGEKPTLRQLTSQNPYAEDFIGPPHVFTIDVHNKTAVYETIKTAMHTEVVPFLPYEFTAEGMLQRLNAFVKYQQFCDQSKTWPPFSLNSAHIILAVPTQSCKDACWQQGLVCESSYFKRINDVSTLRTYGEVSCETVANAEDPHAPSYDSVTQTCFLQSIALLYSCSTTPPVGIQRLCGCRDFIKDQVALCAACL